ncbi:aromatic acid exporter family protein [Streptococcus cristatus]|uniref:aromatic acid exporter family protein n=1 Tax=Streptococcus cristatus TaxID=45634 RepID=UPI0022843A21|nr:aromatic acid exporter family protein [Streptococcus cristatus]MCY7216755.1 aromatic acid exporter family protein [Streptococcus cristatus]
MSLLQRTIKLTLATCLAAWLADFLGLTYSTSAGIIAILSVSDTRRSTAKLAGNRFLSTLLALAIGSLAFHFLGFHLGALAIYIAIYVPLAFRLGWEIGITPSTVLVTHLLLEKSTSWSLLGNELALFLIGTSFALLANLYMPSRQQEINSYHEQVKEQLKKILLRFEYFLKSGDGRNDATLIKELDTLLQEALQLVYLDHSNHLFHQTNYHIHYFEMRQAQNRILEDMAGNINNCQLAASESLILARLFSKTAQQLSQENPAHELVEEIETCLAVFRERPLPKTRQEFETRAMLLQLLRDLETFIKIKVEFYQNYQKVQAS